MEFGIAEREREAGTSLARRNFAELERGAKEEGGVWREEKTKKKKKSGLKGGELREGGEIFGRKPDRIKGRSAEF